jgi:two-component system, NarL family, response regulator DevR
VAIRVFLLDDHELLRRGIRDVLNLEDDLTVVGEAGTAEQAIQGIAAERPDVAVLDVRLEHADDDRGGIEACREIRSNHPDVACIMLTSVTDEDALFAAIMVGASGFVAKQVKGDELVNAIRTVSEGKSLLDPTVVEKAVEKMRNPPVVRDPLAVLTVKEREILDHIAEGLTNRAIGERMYLSEKTVKNYVSSLLAKLGMARRTEAAVYATRRAERHRLPD